VVLGFVEGLLWAWFEYWFVVVVEGLSECCVSRREVPERGWVAVGKSGILRVYLVDARSGT